ncbi:sugar phosphate isomerase/epimerase family protein [Longivirga aurantiaca]|uniref:Sugar phosphate isomerase/epimerase family protein n=1 Tax=Longivirga aurantiaca TaxID=1837743 RepID=A0ABW1SYH0_9ACTN
MKLGYHSITWGGVLGHPVGVTSIKDLFYCGVGDIADAARDIAEAGYTGTEMFDGDVAKYADRPDDLLGLLEANGLELVSVYTGANFIYADILPDEMDKISRAIELAVRFGAERLVVGGGARRAAGTTDEDYIALGNGLDLVDRMAADRGLVATYHPHLTTIVENPVELARIMDLSEIGLCPDTGHLAAAGGDPAAMIRSHSDRIKHVHLKDWKPDPFTWTPLGAGTLDFTDIVRAVTETGYDSWLMVELDEYAGSNLEAAKASKAHLDQIITELGITLG